jgi:DNA modification methylase
VHVTYSGCKLFLQIEVSMAKGPVIPEKLERWPVDRLVPYERNARTHSPEQVAQIAASIVEFGFTNPILVASDAGIIAGHGRLEAAKSLGLTDVPVVVLDHLSDAQRRAYVLADNQLALNAGWDADLLRVELQELEAQEFDLSLLGFSEDELSELLPEVEQLDSEEQGDPDEAPEPPVDPVSKPGDVWLLGKHRLMCGDSTSLTEVERLMDGSKADMVFTDPPYGVSYTDSLGRSIKNDELTDGDLQEFLQNAFASAVAVSMFDSPWYVWHASRFQREFENALNDCAVQVKQQIIWVKGEGVDGTAQVKAPAIGRSDFRWLHEPCFYASRGNPFNAGDRKTTTVWTVNRPTTGTVHPTQKPIPLIEIALNNSAKSKATVLDLFGGSGSTLIACEKTRRYARLMELDPRYCDVIVKRWQAFTGKTATLESTGEPFPDDE